MTTIGQTLSGIKHILFNEYDERAKTVIREFYANENCKVELPDSISDDGALRFNVIDAEGKSYAYAVSLGLLKDAA